MSRFACDSESVQVERKPVDRPVAAGDALFQDRVIEAEERAEEAVVAKEARVKEELTLRKTADDRTQDISDTVRHTEVEIQDERGGRTLAGTATGVGGKIAEHMDVIASDGVKIGTVDTGCGSGEGPSSALVLDLDFGMPHGIADILRTVIGRFAQREFFLHSRFLRHYSFFCPFLSLDDAVLE